MDKQKAAKLLTKGLLNGYFGQGTIHEVIRSGVSGKSNHFKDDGASYHDEWFVPHHTGGGQELVSDDSEAYTRLYAGGTPSEDRLMQLGTTVSEVSAYLFKKVGELAERTRLFEEAKPEAEGDWQYSYTSLFSDDTVGVYVFVEVIRYKGEAVHIHPFILSSVE